MKALKLGVADFVHLMCDFHFNLLEFLTVERLYQLYADSLHSKRLNQIFLEFLGKDITVKDFPKNGTTEEEQRKFLAMLSDLERALISQGTGSIINYFPSQTKKISRTFSGFFMIKYSVFLILVTFFRRKVR